MCSLVSLLAGVVGLISAATAAPGWALLLKVSVVEETPANIHRACC